MRHARQERVMTSEKKPVLFRAADHARVEEFLYILSGRGIAEGLKLSFSEE